MKWLLMLYPRAWRKRYEREVATLLRTEPRRLRTALDLIAGAIDAWLNPEWIPRTTATQGERSMISILRCGSVAISSADRRRSGGWMIAVTLVLTLLYFALLATFGHQTAVQALLYAAFPIAYTVSMRSTYLKRYSRASSNIILTVNVLGWYAFFLAVAALATVI